MADELNRYGQVNTFTRRLFDDALEGIMEEPMNSPDKLAALKAKAFRVGNCIGHLRREYEHNEALGWPEVVAALDMTDKIPYHDTPPSEHEDIADFLRTLRKLAPHTFNEALAAPDAIEPPAIERVDIAPMLRPRLTEEHQLQRFITEFRKRGEGTFMPRTPLEINIVAMTSFFIGNLTQFALDDFAQNGEFRQVDADHYLDSFSSTQWDTLHPSAKRLLDTMYAKLSDTCEEAFECASGKEPPPTSRKR